MYLCAPVLHESLKEPVHMFRGKPFRFGCGACQQILGIGIAGRREKCTAHEQCYDKTDPPPTQSSMEGSIMYRGMEWMKKHSGVL